MRFPRMSTNDDWKINLTTGKAPAHLSATSLLGLCAFDENFVSIVTSVSPDVEEGVHAFLVGATVYNYTVATGAVEEAST